MLSAYSVKWFTVYYFCLGLIGLLTGLYGLYKSKNIAAYLLEKTSPGTPPPRFKIFLRYFLVFTLPTLLLSFFPFSWVEFIFSVWCLLMIYVSGSLLVRWDTIQPILSNQPVPKIKKYIQMTSATLLALSAVMFLLFLRMAQKLGD